MLTESILNTLKNYTQNMQKEVTLVLQAGEHPKRNELVDFLKQVASVSDQLHFEERNTGGDLRSPLSFMLEVEGQANGIRFSGIPGGHEFNSLILALLHSSGTAMKLDSGIIDIIRGINEALEFEVFVSLSCHNCPDVVQALNQFSILNPNISCEMIDGGLFPEIIEERDIQGVPSVYVNGEAFANGKVDTAKLLDKLIERFPKIIERDHSNQSVLPLQDVTVIGGGPAGIAAAIYSARKGLKVTLIADRIGGQVKDTMDIENWIGQKKTTGSELSASMLEHLKEYEVTIKEHIRVKHIENDTIKSLSLSSGEVITTKTLIVATGAKWRELGVPGEKENIGNGVAYCPHCDGPFFKGKDVAVIGGGNSGIEAAIDLAGIVRSVTVFEFMPQLKADQILVDVAGAKENIEIITNAAVKNIIDDNGKVVALEYEDRESRSLLRKDLEGIFIQIGLLPNSGFLGETVPLNAFGEVIINDRCETEVPGIFACGDVTTVPFKQIVISMGEGAKAALSAFDYLVKHFSKAE